LHAGAVAAPEPERNGVTMPPAPSAPTGLGEADALRTIGLPTALAVVISNMVGTGVFTSLGFQVVDLRTGFALLSLWALGGLLALTGALCYAELGAALPRSGGEFVYLSRAFHPALGFTGGWVSITAGFAAPIALAGMAFGRYAAQLVPLTPRQGAIVVLAIVAAVHLADLRLARWFQVTVTSLTVLLIVGFVAVGLLVGPRQPLAFAPSAPALAEIVTAPFAVSLVYVSYAFTGWNAAGYVAGEVRDPSRTIPRAIVGGVLTVTLLYLLLNWTFLRTSPIAELAGKVEVGAVAADFIAGPAGARAMSAVIALLLVATISALVLAGSRVTAAVGATLGPGAMLGRRSRDGVPRNAILFQFALIVLLLVTGSFEAVLTYAGVTLNLSSLLTVVGLVRLRRTAPDLPRPYRVPGYPLTPAIFAALSLWMLVFTARERPVAVLLAVATLATGMALHRVLTRPDAMP
jgi:APA family basic amino acid/polyamine antiporter